MRSIVVTLALAVAAYAATCTDGTTNVFTIADQNDPNLDIHFENVKVQTYDDNGKPACNGNAPSLNLPGMIKLVSGDIKVTAANDLSKEEADLTLVKNSLLIGTVCDNGKSKNPLVPDEDCKIADICSVLGADMCKLLGTPGTYDLATIEKDLNITGTITLPSINGAINGILKGEWSIGILLQANGKHFGNIKLPGNAKWLYIN
ncbi:unnamed protein product, partial [Mesorhabditis belari]|uniref:Uncharacterized protein n=1 Tax=Mesorhabditis belari TaxID=2138241 RepID=A0AAF3F533_9BILA